MTTHQQILKDTNGNDIGVFLPIKDYNAIMELLEDMEDVRDYELAKAKKEDIVPLREAIPLKQAIREIESSRSDL